MQSQYRRGFVSENGWTSVSKINADGPCPFNRASAITNDIDREKVNSRIGLVRSELTAHLRPRLQNALKYNALKNNHAETDSKCMREIGA